MDESEIVNDAHLHDELEVDNGWAAHSVSGGSGKKEVDAHADADDEDAAWRPELCLFLVGVRRPKSSSALVRGPKICCCVISYCLLLLRSCTRDCIYSAGSWKGEGCMCPARAHLHGSTGRRPNDGESGPQSGQHAMDAMRLPTGPL